MLNGLPESFESRGDLGVNCLAAAGFSRLGAANDTTSVHFQVASGMLTSMVGKGLKTTVFVLIVDAEWRLRGEHYVL